jgi:hypothetical protein
MLEKSAGLRVCILSISLILLFSSSSLFPAQEFYKKVNKSGDRLVVKNPFEEVVYPAVLIKGITDYSADTVRFTEGPVLNGSLIAGRLLTDSILTLNPNGTGVWMYDGGFNGFDPTVTFEQADNPLEYLKHQWDALGGKARGYSHPANVLFLRLTSGNRVTYPIEFPGGIKINSLRLITGYRTLDSNQQVEITVSRDTGGEDVIGTYTVSSGGIVPESFSEKGVRHPISLSEKSLYASVDGIGMRFEKIGCSKAYLSLSLKGEGKKWTLIGPVHITAWLDTSGIHLPALKPGENIITYADADISSHKAEVLIKLPPKPEKEFVLYSFEKGTDDWVVSENASIRWNEGAPSGAYKGEGCLSVLLDPQDDGKGGVKQSSVMVTKIPQADWRDYNRLELAINTAGKSPGDVFQRVRIGMYSRPEGYSHLLWIEKSDTWQKYSIDISRMGRSSVRWLKISTYGQRWSTEEKFSFSLDDVRLARYPEEREPEVESRHIIRGLTVEQTKRLKENIIGWLGCKPEPLTDDEKKSTVKKFFPMGVWLNASGAMSAAETLGMDRWNGFKAVLHDLRKHNMNSIMGSGHPFYQDNGRYFDLLEESGIRSWTYGPVYFHDQGSTEKNERWFKSRIEPGARNLAPAARDRWGLLAWGLTEEIDIDMVESLRQYYALMKDISLDDDIVVLHNHLEPQKKHAEVFPDTKVLAWDRYPFRQYWADPLKTWASEIDKHYRVARSIDANLWIVLQSYSQSVKTPGGNTYYARHISHPLQMKAQAWVAVGRGATGLYAYLYSLRGGEEGGGTAFKTLTGDDTPAYKAWAEALAEITPHKELLLKLQRQEKSVAESEDDRIWVTTFRARPKEDVPGTYLIAVNADWVKERTFKFVCSISGPVYDVSTGKKLTTQELGALTISPGSGRIFRVGE